MLDDVRERLLDDPVRRQVERLGQRTRLAFDGELHAHSRRARSLEQRVEIVEPRLRARVRGVSPSARSSFSVRSISAIACRPRTAIVVGGLADALVAHGRAERLGLDDHQADVVRDDVVELPGDAHALLGDRPVGEQRALAVEPLGVLAAAPPCVVRRLPA